MKDNISLPENKKLLGVLIPFGSLVVAALLLLLIIFPRVKGYVDSRQAVADLERQVDDLNQHADNLARINVADYNGKLDSLGSILPEDGDANLAIAQVESALASAGLQLQGLTFSTTSGNQTGGADPASSLKVAIEVVGDINQLQKFITNLSQGLGVLRINALDFSADKNRALTIDLIINSYYQSSGKPPSSFSNSSDRLTADEQNSLSKLETRIQQVPQVVIATVSGTVGRPDPFQ